MNITLTLPCAKALWTSRSCEDSCCFDLSLLSRRMDRDNKQCSKSLIPYSSDSENWYVTSSSLWRRYLQLEWQTSSSNFSYTLYLSSLLSYPANGIKRPQTYPETSFLTAAIFIRRLTFSYTIHLFIPWCIPLSEIKFPDSQKLEDTTW